MGKIKELEKIHASCSAECGRKPNFALQRTVILSNSNLSSPESEEHRELQRLLPFISDVPHGIVCFMPPDGDFVVSVMRGKFNSTQVS